MLYPKARTWLWRERGAIAGMIWAWAGAGGGVRLGRGGGDSTSPTRTPGYS